MANTENVRIRVSPELKSKWDAMLAGRKISQQDAAVSLMEWLVEQEPLIQTMVLGQVPEADKGELARFVLERLAKGGKAKGRGA